MASAPIRRYRLKRPSRVAEAGQPREAVSCTGGRADAGGPSADRDGCSRSGGYFARAGLPVVPDAGTAVGGGPSALMLLLGIDPVVVITDIAGVARDEALGASEWSARTLVDAALGGGADKGDGRRRSGHRTR